MIHNPSINKKNMAIFLATNSNSYLLYHVVNLKHILSGKNFENPEAIKNEVSAYFDAKDTSWFEKGFMDFLKRWEIVIIYSQ